MSKRSIASDDQKNFEYIPSSDNKQTGSKKKKSATSIDKIVEAIRFLKNPKGSSTKAILSHIEKAYGEINEKGIKTALKNGLSADALVQNKNSYLVKGETYEDTSEKVDISVITPGMNNSITVSVGDNIAISYKGSLVSTGSVFDSGKSFTFTVGDGDVIKGMDLGVMGMSVGERRKVTIPSSLGYGRRGSGPEIPPDSALLFDITLLRIR